jgi:hypothetical protein
MATPPGPSPSYRGKIDIVTGRVTDIDTGITYTWADWHMRRRTLMANHVQYLRSLRNEASDMQALWGTKEDRFTDNWYGGYVRPLIPPNPRQDFGPDGDEPPTTVTYPDRPGGPIYDLPGVI